MQIVVKKLNMMGYVVSSQILSAQKYGYPQSRDRWWILGFLISEGPTNQSDEDFVMPAFVKEMETVLQQLEIESLPLDRFLIDDDKCPWAQEFDMRGGEHAVAKKPKLGVSLADDKYKVDLLQAFENEGFSWPPVYDDDFLVYTRHLPERKKQSIWFWEKLLQKHSQDVGDRETSVDTNLSCDWQNVQLNMVPCLVSTSSIWLLKRNRLLTGKEALGLQGFGYNFLDECDPPLANREEVDLAGNAFNGGVCLAVMLALVLSADWSSILDQMENVKARKIPNMEKGLQSAKDLSSVDEEGGEGDGDNIGSEEDLWSDETLSPLF